MSKSIRRVLDVVLSALGIWVTLPIWVLVAIAIRLTSPGPVLYRAARVGKDGRNFCMYKFRTMQGSAERSGPGITGTGDPRITRVGRLLRRTKLDELPQLLNVARGEMSLVGPRPEAPKFVAMYDERQQRVLSVRPGITGPTQLAYRDEERLLQYGNVEEQYRIHVMPRKLELDLQYLEQRTLARDGMLLLVTISRLFRC